MSELTTAARPYARAVYELARDSQSLDAWSERLQYLAVVVTDDTVKAVLDAPSLTHQERGNIVTEVAADQLDEQGNNFVKLLSENRRLDLIEAISIQYELYRAESEGLIEATVVSATEIDEEQSNNIAKALSKRLQREVNVTVTTDPSLISGAIIRAGDLVIDGSVKGKLQNLTQQLAG